MVWSRRIGLDGLDGRGLPERPRASSTNELCENKQSRQIPIRFVPPLQVEVHLIGTRLSHDGYVLDFGDLKAVTKKCCKELNEYMLIPGRSDVIKIGEENRGSTSGGVGENWTLECEDGSFFSLPKGDCKVGG